MKKISFATLLGTVGFLLAVACSLDAFAAPVQGWLNWRGPQQNGTSLEKNLPDKVDPKNPLWVADFPGQSTPVIANGKLYIMGYLGDGPDLQEGVACFDAETGKKLWQRLYNDFISDTIYLRYATASPAIDPETGDVFMQGTQGILAAFTADGKPLWSHSLMEEYGRLTFPNSRTASPVIDGDLVITRGITANWGAQGPAGDRFYAFDKKTGELVWASSPGERPKDNSFSHPQLAWLNGKRVFYAATGDGSVVCVNARTGEPIWRLPLFKAGINATVLVHNNDKIIAIYGVPYEPGQLIAFKIPNVAPTNAAAGPVVIEREKVQLWARDISTSTSSPILAGDMVYVVAEKGDLCAVDANSGEVKWKLKIGIEQRNSSPLFADGKLYVPMLEDPETKAATGEAGTTGAFYIVKPGDKAGEIISHAAVDGRCFGTPVAFNGKVYLQTTKHLYCWGTKGNNPSLKPIYQAKENGVADGVGAMLQIIPSEVLLRPGGKVSVRAKYLDKNGFVPDRLITGEVLDLPMPNYEVRWTNYVPPTAKVKSIMKASFDPEGKTLIASPEPVPSAGAFEARFQRIVGRAYGPAQKVGPEVKGYIRGRVLPYLPLKQDFESFTLTETNASDGALFAYPPLPWIGARFKFEVREKDGNKVFTKTIDNRFFQRATVFLGAPDAKNYTIEADVMSEGNRRKMSEVGVINQRYAIVLKGNDQKLEVSSNFERLREAADVKWLPNVWYRLKSRVDLAADGSGTVRGKVWKKGDSEPDAWTIEVKHKTAHQNGSPGLFGFSPQDQRVYIDNINVTAN